MCVTTCSCKWSLNRSTQCTGYLVPVGQISGGFYHPDQVPDPAQMLNGTGYFIVSITALECKCHKIWLDPNHCMRIRGFAFMRYINPRLIDWLIDWLICKQPNINDALQCATTTQVKSQTSTHCSLYTSYTTSCMSSACTAMEKPSQYPVLVLVGSGQISKIWIQYIRKQKSLNFTHTDTLLCSLTITTLRTFSA